MQRTSQQYRVKDEPTMRSRSSAIKIQQENENIIPSLYQESQQSMKTTPKYQRNQERLSLQVPQQQYFNNNLSNQTFHKSTSVQQIITPQIDLPSPQVIRKSIMEAPSPFYISSEQLSQYEKYATSIDKEGKGIIEGSQVREIFSKSKLTVPMLRQIWALLDTTKKGFLTRYEFIGMVHIVRLCSNGIRIPLALPNEIKELLVMHDDYYQQNNLSLKTSLETKLNQHIRQQQLDQGYLNSSQKINNFNIIKEQFSTQQSDNAEEDDSESSRHFTLKKDIRKRLSSLKYKNNNSPSINFKNTSPINGNRFSFTQQPHNFNSKDNRNQNPIEFIRSESGNSNKKDEFKKHTNFMAHIDHSSIIDSTNNSNSMDQDDNLADIIQAFRETTKKVEEKNAYLEKSLTKLKKYEKQSMKRLEEIGHQFSRNITNNNELSQELVDFAKQSIQTMTEKAQEILEKNRQLNRNSISERPWEGSNEQNFLSSYPNIISNYNGIQS